MASRPIKVLYLIDYFHRTGGTETHLAQLVRMLPREGFECEVVAFDLGSNPLIDEIRTAGVPVHCLPVRREYTPVALLQGWRLAAMIRRKGFDIVQTFHQKSDTFGALVAKLAGVPHIVSSKRDTGHLRKARHFFLNRRLRSLFERIIVVADAVGKAVVATDHLDPSRLVRIYNGVDTVRFAPATPAAKAEARQRLGLSSGDFVVGMVAGFRPEKNYRMLFDGALGAAATIPNLKILAVGDGPLLPSMRLAYAASASIMRFAGDLRDVTQAIAAMDVGCLLPSQNEGFSNAVIEKMAMGLPMIVTDVGGNAEAVDNGYNGFVIPPGDVIAFSRALCDIHGDPETRLEMGKRSRQMTEERFSLAQMRKQHEDLYRQLCKRDRAA